MIDDSVKTLKGFVAASETRIPIKIKMSYANMYSEQQRLHKSGNRLSSELFQIEVSHNSSFSLDFQFGTKLYFKLPPFFDGKKKRKCPLTKYFVHTAMPITTRTRSSCIIHRYVLQLSVDELF